MHLSLLFHDQMK